MAFEKDFIERFKEDGRNALLKYHRGLKQANLDMVPVVTGLMQINKAGDQRFTAHFETLAQREEHNLMCLIGPPDRADYEMLTVSPEVGAMIYKAYALINSTRCDHLKSTAPPEVISHLVKVTQLLESLAQAAHDSTTRVQIPIALINLAYDSVLAEVDPLGYARAMGQAH
jgi:hypothetical protein